MPPTLLLAAHAVAAVMFVLVAAGQAARWRAPAARTLVAACLATAGWLCATIVWGPHATATQAVEALRNLGWLGFVLVLGRRERAGRNEPGQPMIALLGIALAVTAAAAAATDTLAARIATLEPSVLLAAWSLHMIFAVGALVAVHHLFTAVASQARRAVGLPLAGLALLWLYDLTLYATCWAQRGWADRTGTVRAVVVVLAAAAIAIGVWRNARLAIRLSRSATFQTIGLVAALAYLFVVMVAAAALDAAVGRGGVPGGYGGGGHGVQATALIVAALAVAVGMTSARARAWTQVMLAKHLFAHRYDYRTEWLRFTETLGVPGDDSAPLETRVVKAIADIVQSPGGLLLLPGEGAPHALQAGPRWGWSTVQPGGDADATGLARVLATGRVIELDTVRDGRGLAGEAASVPEWMIADRDAWAITPLIHLDRLVGGVLLERPLVERALDWEDFDLLRLAGRQVASYLAEARAQDALTEAQRFDEFNRRFAFILHDIKNLVSQLTLVTRNAQRHADKPEFRADMVATLQDATTRMTDLLARLTRHDVVPTRGDGAASIDLHAVAAGVAAGQRARHPIVVAGCATSFATADAARLSKALSHLVANAIDASPTAEPVTLTLVARGPEVGIEVRDEGVGMTAEFIRTALFRPFASTKPDGFGVGAYEARGIVAAMGGRIAVESEEGVGTRLTIWLPAALVPALAPPHVERHAA